MPDLVQQSIDHTIQSSVKNDSTSTSGFLSSIILMGQKNNLISPWWSPSRDNELNTFWRTVDHLSGALYTMISKMTTVPFKIVPRDMSIKIHHDIADQYTEALLRGSQFGAGWVDFYSRWVESYLTQDNGSFIEIIGDGAKDGPIIGRPYTMAVLDASRCTRTSHPMFPVVYTDTDGKKYKLHFTRVISMASMPSFKSSMHGVGFCSISRCLMSAQNMLDVATYKQEKMGSRPPREIIITGGGLDPDDFTLAVAKANQQMSSQGLSRFSKTIVMGASHIPDAKAQKFDLVSTPDWFKEEEATVIAMVIIANGLGIDAKEIFPMSSGGGTKADAIIQHLKQRGKGPGQILQLTENQLDQKFLPPFLHATFDYQDDAEDRQIAEIHNINAQERERDFNNGFIDDRIGREFMMRTGELTEAQFEYLELSSGRLSDGVSIETLFYSKDKDFVELLSGGESDAMRKKCMEVIMTSRDVNLIRKARQALAAIDFKIEQEKQEELERKREESGIADQQAIVAAGAKKPDSNPAMTGKPKPPDTSYQDEKFGRKLPVSTGRIPDEENNYQKDMALE